MCGRRLLRFLWFMLVLKEPEAVSQRELYGSQVGVSRKYGGPVRTRSEVIGGLEGKRDALQILVETDAFHGVDRYGLAGARPG